MRKYIAIVLALGMGAALTGCGNEAEPQQTMLVRRFENRTGAGIEMGVGIPPEDIEYLTQLMENNGIAAQVVPVMQFYGQLMIENAPEITEHVLILHGIAPEHGFLLGENAGMLQDDVVYLESFPHENIDLHLSVVTEITDGGRGIVSGESMNLSFAAESSVSPRSALLPTHGMGKGELLDGFVTLGTFERLNGYQYAEGIEDMDHFAVSNINRVYVHVEDVAGIEAARQLLTNSGYDILA